MQINVALFDHVLHHIGLSEIKPSFVVIGAMDGISYDEFHNFVRTYHWSGLLVEPIPEQFRRLVYNYSIIGCSPNNKYENCAVAEHNGTTQMLMIDQAAVDQGAVHACFGGMSAIYPPRNGLSSEGDAETVRRFGRIIEVPCLTLESLLEKHDIDAIDVLCIDAEGWDFNIFKQLDFKRWRPNLIRLEYVNLSDQEKLALTELLEINQYSYHVNGMDIDAVATEYWDSITKQGMLTPSSASRPAVALGLTFATSLLSLAADNADSPSLMYQRAVEYLQKFNTDQPLVIYAAPGPTELAARTRSADITHVAIRKIEDLVQQEQYLWIQKALSTSKEYSKFPPDMALHIWLSLCKPFLFNDATVYDPFCTELFFWVDIEQLSVVSDGLHEKNVDWERALEEIIVDARLWVPIVAKPPRKALEQLVRQWSGDNASGLLPYSVTANALAGSKVTINTFNGAYYACLQKVLNEGHLCSPEEIVSIMAYTYPHLFNLFNADQLGLTDLSKRQ
jgi:FkbM family methyltransferase